MMSHEDSILMWYLHLRPAGGSPRRVQAGDQAYSGTFFVTPFVDSSMSARSVSTIGTIFSTTFGRAVAYVYAKGTSHRAVQDDRPVARRSPRPPRKGPAQNDVLLGGAPNEKTYNRVAISAEALVSLVEHVRPV
jgi:hypothetical protein